MFRFVKKIKISFIKKQKLINEIEYLKKRNDFLDDMLKNLETISYNSLKDNISMYNLSIGKNNPLFFTKELNSKP